MRTLFAAAVCALTTALPLLAQSNWQTVEGPDKSFRIQGPGKPTIQKQPFRVAGKDVVLYSYLFVDVPYAFILGYGDYPPEYINKRKTEELLSLDHDRFVKTTGTKLSKQRSVNYQGRPALDFVAEAEDSKSLFQVRIVLVDNRIYILAVSYPTDADPAAANKFLDSLQLAESKK